MAFGAGQSQGCGVTVFAGAGQTVSVVVTGETLYDDAECTAASINALVIADAGQAAQRTFFIADVPGSYTVTLTQQNPDGSTVVLTSQSLAFTTASPVSVGPIVATEDSLVVTATTATAPGAGGAGALPATPTGYATVKIGGVNRQVAFY